MFLNIYGETSRFQINFCPNMIKIRFKFFNVIVLYSHV